MIRMTISSQLSASLLDSLISGQKPPHADISVDILQKVRETNNRESNAIVDRIPEEKPVPVGLKLDVYA
jgi:hypothetical protein